MKKIDWKEIYIYICVFMDNCYTNYHDNLYRRKL